MKAIISMEQESERMNELKPCPFCGEKEKIYLRETLNKKDFWVECVTCGTQQRLSSYAGAIEAWNRRTNE